MLLPDAQLRTVLAPASRDWRSRPGLTDAAVLAPIFARDGRDWLLFTQRRDDLEAHAGQMSFPGGRREDDEDALTCALRESYEEIGLDPDTVDVLGRLADRDSSTGYLVHAFVGRIASADGLVLDRREVEELVAIPIEDLRRVERWQLHTFDVLGRTRQTRAFVQQGRVLWGLTAKLALDLLQRVELLGPVGPTATA